MREILFRGKRVDNGEWVEGFYYSMTCLGITHYMILEESEYGWRIHMVDPYTVGQFTGLTENGKKIFEGDIVHVHDCLLKPSAPYHEFDGVVEYKYASFAIVNDYMTHYRWLDYDVTVLGNVTDNPELLEGE